MTSEQSINNGHSNIQIVGNGTNVRVIGRSSALDRLYAIAGEYIQDVKNAHDIVRRVRSEEKAKTIAAKEEIRRAKMRNVAGLHSAIPPLSASDMAILHAVIERERRQQDNTSRIVEFAAASLVDTEVGDEIPEAEWVDQFFEYCKSVSTEQMQRLWGHILSQKIKSPNIGKPLTLHCMRMLSHANAKIFESLCDMALVTKDKIFVLKDMVEHFEYGDLLELENIGLINAGKDIWFYTKSKHDQFPKHFDAVIHLTPIEKGRDSHIAVIPFTTSGIELFGLIGQPQGVERNFLPRIVELFTQHGVFLTVQKQTANT